MSVVVVLASGTERLFLDERDKGYVRLFRYKLMADGSLVVTRHEAQVGDLPQTAVSIWDDIAAFGGHFDQPQIQQCEVFPAGDWVSVRETRDERIADDQVE